MKLKRSRRDKVTRQLVGKDGAQLWSEQPDTGALLDDLTTMISVSRSGDVFVARRKQSKRQMLWSECHTEHPRDRFIVLAIRPDIKNDVFIVDDIEAAFLACGAWEAKPERDIVAELLDDASRNPPTLVWDKIESSVLSGWKGPIVYHGESWNF